MKIFHTRTLSLRCAGRVFEEQPHVILEERHVVFSEAPFIQLEMAGNSNTTA